MADASTIRKHYRTGISLERYDMSSLTAPTYTLSDLEALRERCAKVAKIRAASVLKPYAHIFNQLAADILSVSLITSQCENAPTSHAEIEMIAPEYWCPKCMATSANSRRCGSCDNPVQCLNIEAIVAQRDSLIAITTHTEEGTK